MGQLWILLTFCIVFLEVCLTGCLSTWILSTLESGHMPFCPRSIVSTIGSIKSVFYPRLVLSAWDYVHKGLFLFEIISTLHSVHLGVCLLVFCPLGSLATWHSPNVWLCPLLVLSTLDSSHAWFCLLRSLSTWLVVYLESVHFGIWPHDFFPA